MPEDTPTDPQRSIGELIGRISHNVSALVRGEIDLLKTKATTSAKRYGTAAAFFAVAGVLALFGLPFILWTLVYVLAIFLPLWAATLIVGGVVFLLAGLMVLLGLRKIKSAGEVQLNGESIGLSVEAVKEGLNR